MDSALLGRGGEQGDNGSGKKRKRNIDDLGDDHFPAEERIPKRRKGRPRNKPAIPPPEVPIPIAPRPGQPVGRVQGYVPEEEEPATIDLSSTPQDIDTGNAGATINVPAPAVDATPLVHQLIDIPPPTLPIILSNRPCAVGRGPQPVNFDPSTRQIEMKIYCGEEAPAPELDINNAVINTGFPESFVNPKDLWWMNSPVVSLEGHEIRTIFTPRGRIRCTQAVVLSFTFPQLKLPVHHVRTLVLPDDHPDPEVTVIIGQPWIRQLDLEAEFQTLSAYVPTTFPTAGNALEYPNEPSRPWPHNVLSADPGQADPHYGLDASKSDE